MSRYVPWVIAWILAIAWCVGIRPFLPIVFPLEPCIPLLVASLMLGPLRLVIPMFLLSGILLDAFQPFPQPVAFFALFGVALLVGLSVRFILANRSYYSALILVVVSRVLIAGCLLLVGPGFAAWPADRAFIASPIFLLVTTLIDALFLLIGFRLVSRPLLGLKRVQIAR